jgi:outer membrane receptor protein involved in Fe transport
MSQFPHCATAMAVAIAALFSGQIVFAEEPEKKLQAVEVVGTSPLPGLGIEKNKLPYDVQTVTSDQINNGHSLNLSEFMSRNLTGVNINEIQGSPFQADITYRGFRLSGILGSPQGLSVYLDGVRVNEPFGDVVNWDMMPEAAISNVTLVPGSNPVYGLNTLGGALAFTTKSGLTAPGTEVKLSLGSWMRKRADVSYGEKSDDGWHKFLAATAFHEDGWRKDSEGQLGNVFVKIGRTQADVNWDLSFLHGRSNLLGNGLLPSYSYDAQGNRTNGMYETNRRWGYTYDDRTKNELSMVNFNLQRFLDGETELATNAYVRYSTRSTVGGDAGIDAGQVQGVINETRTRQAGYGASTNLTKILQTHQITTGASLDASRVTYGGYQASDCNVDAARFVGDCTTASEQDVGVRGNSYALGLYASDTYAMAASTHLTAAARFNHARVSNTLTNYTAGVGTEKPNETFSYNSLNPSFGVSHKLDERADVFGNIGQSNRVPTVIELGCADATVGCRLPTGLQADPYLKQVIARTVEFGTRKKVSDDSGYTVSFYRSDNSNDILFTATDQTGLGYFSNFSKTRRQGVDLSAYTRINQVDLRISYSYLQATYQAAGELFGGGRVVNIKSGDRIAGLPEHTIKLNADWHAAPKWMVGGTVIATSSLVTQGNEDGKVAETVSANAKVDGYFLLNLHANYEVTKGLDYFARLNNVFDRRYETYGLIANSMFNASGVAYDVGASRFVAPGAPRSILVGLHYRF